MSIFDKENLQRIKRLLGIMLPIIATQISIMGMNFFDASMSGRAGNVELAGAAIGGNIWMPVQTGFVGILIASTPMAAHLLGGGKTAEIGRVIRHGLLLALLFSFCIISCGYIFLPIFFSGLGLAEGVYRVALGYTAGIGIGVVPFFCMVPLRSLVDTMGYTRLTMKIYFLALPINAVLNYLLIFGKWGLPRLGGVGAGVATGITFWILFFMFTFVVSKAEPFKKLQIFSRINISGALFKEYLRIGIPMGVSIFMETSIFGVVAFFVAKFGTDVIAAHQAALNFSSVLYMIPLSFSMALTIIIGVEYGAGNLAEVRSFMGVGLRLSLFLLCFYMAGVYFGRESIAQIYSSNRQVISLIKDFLLYAIIWQAGDAIAAPVQGILRGLKDVDATFYAGLLAYWIICLPAGLFLDYYLHQGAASYWISLVVGVCSSACLLYARMVYLRSRRLN
ncbi:MAG: MATE family efflux transporter [Acidaminococcaceae bacterium]|nr:MATE family efflux transporter [Acidaminococcaceae bacterium]